MWEDQKDLAIDLRLRTWSLWTVWRVVFEGLVLFGWWPTSPSLPHVLRESSSPALPITLPIPLHIPLPGLPFVAPSASLYNSTFSSPSLPLIPSPYMATVGPASARHPSPPFRKVSSRMPTHHRAPSSSYHRHPRYQSPSSSPFLLSSGYNEHITTPSLTYMSPFPATS